MDGHEEKAHVAELLSGFALAAVALANDQSADLGGSLVVVADAQHGVPEVLVDGLAVVLALADLEIDVRCLEGAVLSDDHRRAHDRAGAMLTVGQNEQVRPVEGVANSAAEAANRLVDQLPADPLIVGQIDAVELGAQALESWQIGALHVAK